MHFYVDDRFIFLKFENEIEKTLLVDYFTFDDYSKVFNGGSFDKRKIKQFSFLKKKKDYYWLFSGFARDVILFCKKNNILINTIEDKRTRFEHQEKDFTNEEIKEHLPDFDYVDHQVEALKNLLKKNVGIIKAPTGTGKTEIFISLIKATKLPTIIIVNRISLATQIANRLSKSGIDDIGLFHSKSNKKGKITITTIGSVKKVPNLSDFKLLIIDEIHHAQSDTYQDFLKNTSYPLRFGFSATPDPGDKFKYAKIRQFVGDIIYETKAEKLIDNNVIAKPEIIFERISCPPTLDWYSANDKCIINNVKRNEKISDIIKKHNTSTLVLIRNIDHGEMLEEMIDGSVFVSGIDSDDTRQEVIKKFENEELQVIISSNIFNEGISIDNIHLLIIASGGKAITETTQKIGRGLRSMGGKKTKVFVYDFDDIGNRFTEKHSSMRKRIYKKQGFEVM
jgi:superfamily II DNA or RNA helicase